MHSEIQQFSDFTHIDVNKQSGKLKNSGTTKFRGKKYIGRTMKL